MNKLLVLVAALFALGHAQMENTCCTQQQMQTFPDVPAGHWAAEAVDRMTDLGIIIGFPDGTFRGNENLTRYEASMMFDRLVNLLNANLASMQTMSDADVEALRLAVESLSGQVAGLAQRVSANEVTIASITRDYGAIGSNTSRISELELLVTQLSNRPVASGQTVTQTVGVPEELVARINNNALAAERMNSLAATIQENSTLLASLRAGMDGFSAQDAMLLASVDDINAKLSAAMNQANAAMDQANLAVELYSGQPVADAPAPVSGRIAQFEQRVANNERSIDALNSLIALLNSDLVKLESRVAGLRGGTPAPMAPVTNLGPLESEVASNRSQIQGIREFAILLRRNQVAFDKRLDALDGNLDAVSSSLNDLGQRVSTIEENLLTFSGELTAQFTVVRVRGYDFDVDRLFGYDDFKRLSPSGGSTFGDEDSDEDDFDDPPGYSGFSTSLDAKFGFANDSAGLGSPNALNSFDGVITLKLTRASNILDADGDPLSNAYVFNLGDALFYYDPIGNDLLSFGFGEDVDVRFSDYVVNTDLQIDDDDDGDIDDNINTPGFVARLGSPEFLEFLDPSLTFVYTSPDVVAGEDLGSDAYLYGIRGELRPQLIDRIDMSGGISYAMSVQNDLGFDDDLLTNPGSQEDNITTTVFGVDGEISFTPLSIEFEYANASRDDDIDATPDSISAFFVTAAIDPFTVSVLDIDKIAITYRDIAGGWRLYDGLNTFTDGAGAVYDGQATAEGRFEEDQAGIRVNVDFSLFIFDVDAYYDNYFIARPNAVDEQYGTTAFGIDADINIFRGFAVTGFFHSASIEDVNDNTYKQVDDVVDGRTEGTSPLILGSTERDDKEYDTGYGIGIAHSGDSEFALVPNLNLYAEFARINAGFDTTRIKVGGDYELDVAFLMLNPYVDFTSINNPDDDQVSTRTISAGTNILTDPLEDVIFKPSFESTINYRTRTYDYTDNNGSDDYTATQLQFSVGLSLNEFLLPYSVLTARYGMFLGTNVDANPGEIFDGINPNGGDDVSSITSGYEITWDYYDLEFAYGRYSHDRDTSVDDDDAVAQAFRIKYKVTF